MLVNWAVSRNILAENFFYWSNQWQLPGGHLKITLKTNITDPEKFFKIQVIASVFVKQISKGLKLLMIL